MWYKRLMPNIEFNKNAKMFLFVVFIVFIKMLVLNFLTFFGADDYTHALPKTLPEVFQKVYWEYMNLGGRSVVHVLLKMALMFPKGVFNVLNSIMLIALTLLIYKHASSGKSFNIILYLFIIFSIWLYTMSYGNVILWPSGSVNYLWGAVIIMSFLLPYSIYLNKGTVFRHTGAPIIGMFFLGVLSGWCDENTSGGAILLVILFLIYCKIFKQKIKAWMITGFFGSLTGFLLMILAPGNFARAAGQETGLLALAQRFNHVTYILHLHFTTLIVIFLILVTVLVLLSKDFKRAYISASYFIAAVAVLYAMFLSPLIPGRAFFGVTVFLITACAYGMSGFSFEVIRNKVIACCLVAVLGFQFFTWSIHGIYDIALTWKVVDNKHKYIQQEINQGNLDIVVPNDLFPYPQTRWNPRGDLSELGTNPNAWLNYRMAIIYGLESIKREG